MVWSKKSPVHCACFSLRQTMCTRRNITDADVWIRKVWFYFLFLSLGACCLGNLRQPDAVLAVLSMTTSWQRKYSLRLQPPWGADWSSWRKKRLWPNLLTKSTAVTQWKQEEKQMDGLPLPHMSKCNLYLFPFPVLTPPPPNGRLLLGNPASLLHRCSAVLLLPLGPLLCTGVGKSHVHMSF